jgi:hypothetical protein
MRKATLGPRSCEEQRLIGPAVTVFQSYEEIIHLFPVTGIVGPVARPSRHRTDRRCRRYAELGQKCQVQFRMH